MASAAPRQIIGGGGAYKLTAAARRDRAGLYSYLYTPNPLHSSNETNNTVADPGGLSCRPPSRRISRRSEKKCCLAAGKIAASRQQSRKKCAKCPAKPGNVN